jgi:hypothetical protein
MGNASSLKPYPCGQDVGQEVPMRPPPSDYTPKSASWPYEREREITRHRPYLYSRQDLIAPLRAVADPKRVFPTCPGTGRFAVFLSPELNFTEGFCSEVPVPNG